MSGLESVPGRGNSSQNDMQSKRTQVLRLVDKVQCGECVGDKVKRQNKETRAIK